MQFDVMFYEAFEEEAAALSRCLPGDLRAGMTWKTIQESGEREPLAPLISVRTQSAIPLAWAGRLAGILTRSTGYDHLADYRRRTGAGLQLGYLPLYCNRAVAEHALLLWMALLRRLPRQVSQFRQFQRDGLTGSECFGKTLVVVGVGMIGHEVALLGQALGMRVLGVDPVRRWEDVLYLPFEDAAPQADVLVVSMNLTANNRGYFDATRLAAVKRGAIFVNVARGEFVAAAALLQALESGALRGVGLDVYDREPELAVAMRGGLREAGPEAAAVMTLCQREDVVCTPHNAFNSAESVGRKAEQSVAQVVELRNAGRFLWPVPPEA